MIRRTIYLRRAEDGSIERCSVATADDGTPRSRQEVYLNGPWEATGLGRHTAYEKGATFGSLIDQWAIIDELEEIEDKITLTTQRAIGRQLYRALFGAKRSIGDRWIHLVPLLAPAHAAGTADDNSDFIDLVYRLPWSFLTIADDDRASFLSRTRSGPGSITLDAWPDRGATAPFETKLPPHPVVLLVIPLNSTGKEDTFGKEHLKVIQTALGPYYEKPTLQKNVIHASTFEEFSTALETMRPHVIYFYGHAKPSGNSTVFWFDHGKVTQHVDVGEICGAVQRLRETTPFAPVVWVNACQSAAAERNNFLRLLSPLAATVLATRTLAAVADSRAIAEKALPAIVIGGHAPHAAIRDVLSTSPPPMLAGRWATTVISVQYELWSALGTEERQVPDLESAGDFPMRVDRTHALSSIAGQLGPRLRLPPTAPHVVVWKGPPEQSLEVFTRRFIDHLAETFPDWSTVELRVSLQLDPRPASESENDDLVSVLIALLGRPLDPDDVTTVNHKRIRDETMRLSKPRTVLLFVHGPFTRANLGAVNDYLKNWRSLHAAIDTQGGNVHVVLCFAFNDENTVAEGPTLVGDGFITEPLGPVSPRELAEHMAQFRLFYNYAPDEIDAKANELARETNGMFRLIHARLEKQAQMIRWSRRGTKQGEQNG
ncbi:hypothetical protein [Bradyrhizobium yuanmingense]|uniref:CHAT domain-containing protein n=1 Tax=Bradyrhizobium yuanmingense TaxID=108015 RepID=A0ABV4GD20_9BRAD|nr:hypothetical protein [Bradyrhizobium yuanmingense]